MESLDEDSLETIHTAEVLPIQQEVNVADYERIQSEVLKGSVLGPFICLIYTSEIPVTNNSITGTSAAVMVFCWKT